MNQRDMQIMAKGIAPIIRSYAATAAPANVVRVDQTIERLLADARKEWLREVDRIGSETRALIADLRAENVELRSQLKALVDGEVARVRDALALVKDGVDGQPGEKGERGEPGPAPDYGVVIERAEPLLKNLIAARWDDWTATLPLPERGEKGEKGEPGPAVDPEAVAAIVLRQLPQPERGEKGDPGRDTDPEAIERLVAEKCGEALPQLLDLIADEVALLPTPERGEKGEPGKDADPELIQRMVEATVARSIPDPLPGPQGERGPPGQDIDPEDIVARVLPMLPAPERGPQGAPGRSITEVKRIGDELLVVMNDGSTFSAGVVRGERGDTGPAGPMGATGPAGDPGRDGREVDLDMLEALVSEKVATVRVPEDVLARMVDDVVALVPKPKDGERGPPGEPADPAVIEALVAEKVAALPPPEKGEPGRDADPELVTELVTKTVAEAVAQLPPPEKGEPGPEGPPGRDADPEMLRQMVVDEVTKLPPPERGEPGPAGADGKDADPEMIAALVVEEVGKAVAEIPLPRDGFDGKDADPALVESLVVETVAAAVKSLPPPERGEPGPRGEIGPPGKDGAGVSGALIDRNGSLILTLSDGSVRELGGVVGKDGAPGAPGRDGVDGLSFDAFVLEPEYDGERTLRLKWTDAKGKEQSQEWRLPIVMYRGVWNENAAYEKGDSVTWAGSCWIAERDGPGKPNGPETGWKLAVKSGRDGRDGKPGEKGERGAEGRPGRDWTQQGYTTP